MVQLHIWALPFKNTSSETSAFMGNEDIVGLTETHRCRNRLLKLSTELMTKHVQQQALTTLKIQEEERRRNIHNLQLCKNLKYINEELWWKSFLDHIWLLGH